MGLVVGSKIPLEILVFDETLEIEVVGIFNMPAYIGSEMETIIRRNAYNTFFAPNVLLSHINHISRDLYASHYTELELETLLGPSMQRMHLGNPGYGFFSLYDFRYVDAFYEEAKNILPKGTVIAMPILMGIGDASSSLLQIHNIVNNALLVAVGACFLIAGLTFMLFLVDRRYEIGIYLSLGQSKVKILTQLIIEILLIGTPVFLLTVFIGNFLTTHVSSWLLTSFLSIENHFSPQNVWQYTNRITEEQVYAIQQIPLDTSTILIFLIALVLTVFLSILIPTVYLFRLNPKKILM